MDRRSWLWRRKSSEKSPGETESSGSASSQFERFSDDQVCSNHQSPEVTSKVAPSDEVLNDSVKCLTEKLSAAFLNIRAKEDLVRQHAKVAEEAVSGWEKAESEVLALKHHLEASTQKNLVLEDRICHLDGALKECVRQLRQAREEQEQKIHEAVAKNSHEWEFEKSELENKLVELQCQLEATKIKPFASVDADLRPKLEAVEKENSVLKVKLLSRVEELETRIIERDLSTQAAETASKQHLESIRKVAKLEAECRRLMAVACKASPANDHRSLAASVYVESTNCQSDSGDRILVVDNGCQRINGLDPNECEASHSESWTSVSIAGLDQFRNDKVLGRNRIIPSVEINLMDDFLEMERLAALPEAESRNCCPKPEPLSDQRLGEGPLNAELEAIINRTAELEEKLEKSETEKVELEVAFIECQDQLMTSRDELMKAETKLMELQNQLCMANEPRNVYDAKLGAVNSKRESAESQLLVTEAETKTLLVRVGCLEEEVQNERALSGVAVIKCQKMEDENLKMKHEAEIQNSASLKDDLKAKQEKELATAASKLTECQKTIASLRRQLKCLADMEDLLSESESEWDKTLEVLKEGSNPKDGPKSLKMHPADFPLPAKGYDVPGNVNHAAVPVSEENDKGLVAIRKQGSEH